MPKDRQDLSGKLTNLAQKRITKERQKIEEERKELEDCGIFTVWGDELHKTVALIVGPEDTPYAHGFYLFEVQFTDNYPMQPPHVVFRTGDGRVRFNPNLYVEGKSLLNAHPIQNEPGHEKERGKNDTAYSDIIRYENIAVAVVRMLKQTPPKFEAFRPMMRAVFLKRFDSYLKTLEAYTDRTGSAVSPIWAFSTKFKAKELVAELKELQAQLLEEEAQSGAPDAEADAGQPASGAEGDGAAAAAAASGEKRAADCVDHADSSDAKKARSGGEPG